MAAPPTPDDFDGHSIHGIVIKQGKFGHRRKAPCCGEVLDPGDVAIVIPVKMGAEVVRTILLHARCMRELLDRLPLDAKDYNARADEIRRSVLETGNPFPKPTRRQRRKLIYE